MGPGAPRPIVRSPSAPPIAPPIFTGHTSQHSVADASPAGRPLVTIAPLHIAAGAIGIVSGAFALYSAKGGRVHRNSGVVFFWSMLAMAFSGGVLGVLREQHVNASQGALTFYLVATGMIAVQPRYQAIRALSLAAMLAGLLVAAYDLSLGMQALQRPRRTIDGVPAAMVFMFGAIALVAALGDLRLLLTPSPTARQRIGRHLWRMCLGLWIACASFFLGQAKVIPEPLRIMPLLALPVLLVLGTMLYWMVRVMVRGKPWIRTARKQQALEPAA